MWLEQKHFVRSVTRHPSNRCIMSDILSGPLIGRKVPLMLTFRQLTTAAQNAFFALSTFRLSLFTCEMKAVWPDQNPSRDPDKIRHQIRWTEPFIQDTKKRKASVSDLFLWDSAEYEDTWITWLSIALSGLGCEAGFYHASLLKLPQWDKCTKDRKDKELAVWNIICRKWSSVLMMCCLKWWERNEMRWEGCCVCDVVYQSIKWVRCKWLLLQSGNLIAT